MKLDKTLAMLIELIVESNKWLLVLKTACNGASPAVIEEVKKQKEDYIALFDLTLKASAIDTEQHE